MINWIKGTNYITTLMYLYSNKMKYKYMLSNNLKLRMITLM